MLLSEIIYIMKLWHNGKYRYALFLIVSKVLVIMNRIWEKRYVCIGSMVSINMDKVFKGIIKWSSVRKFIGATKKFIWWQFSPLLYYKAVFSICGSNKSKSGKRGEAKLLNGHLLFLFFSLSTSLVRPLQFVCVWLCILISTLFPFAFILHLCRKNKTKKEN